MSWIYMPPSFDGTYLGCIAKLEECGVTNFYERTVLNVNNEWVLEKGERLICWMRLPPMPIELQEPLSPNQPTQP